MYELIVTLQYGTEIEKDQFVTRNTLATIVQSQEIIAEIGIRL